MFGLHNAPALVLLAFVGGGVVSAQAHPPGPARAPGVQTVRFLEAPPAAWMKRNLPDETSGVMLGGGAVLFATSSTSEIRYASHDDETPKVIARRGGGAGQYSFIEAILPLGNGTAGVVDPGNQRLTIFDRRGRVRSVVALHPPGGDLDGGRPQLRVRGMFGDGRFLAWLVGPRVGSVRSMIKADSALLVVLGRNGRLERSDRWFRGPGFYTYRESSPLVVDEMPLRPRTVVAVGRSSYFLSTGAEHQVAEYRIDGSFVRTFGTPDPPPRLDQATIDRWKAARVAAAPHVLRSSLAQALAWVPYPPRSPGYTALHLDDDARLWAARFAVPGEPVHWDVYSPTGALIAQGLSPVGGIVQWIQDGEAVIAFAEPDGTRFARYELQFNSTP